MSIGKPQARSEDRRCGVLTLQRCLFGPANRTWRRSWHPSYGTAPLPAQPLTGVFACALAFRTLFSSQGADANHPRLFNLFRGNPTNLPEQPEVVNQVLEPTWFFTRRTPSIPSH